MVGQKTNDFQSNENETNYCTVTYFKDNGSLCFTCLPLVVIIQESSLITRIAEGNGLAPSEICQDFQFTDHNLMIKHETVGETKLCVN